MVIDTGVGNDSLNKDECQQCWSQDKCRGLEQRQNGLKFSDSLLASRVYSKGSPYLSKL